MRRIRAIQVLSPIAILAALALVPTTAQASFDVGIQAGKLSGAGTDASTASAYQAMRSVGGSVVRVSVVWAAVAGPTPFNLSDPSDPHYVWTHTDEAVRRAAQHHLRVMLMVFDAPPWAEGPGLPVGDPNVGPGAWEPNPSLFRQFMHALAKRYSGSFPDPLTPGASLPRVKDFELWNEPNLGGYIAGPDGVGHFRALVNAGYSAIKAVHSNNVAVAGGLAPIATKPGIYSVHPVTFTQRLFCLRPVRNRYVRIRGCPKIHFDALGIHPYEIAATPTKPAYDRLDFLVPDTGKIRNLLRAAERLHTISSGHHALWNTEWTWFTNPPQPAYGDPPNVAARYVAYSMYEFWKAGVTLVVWQTLADTTSGSDPGGGLETQAGTPKPTMTAFGFPFIASVSRGQGYAWGRAPNSRHAKVFVEHQVRHKWRRVATARTDGSGIFSAHFKAHGNGTYRARVVRGGQTSLPYYSAKIPPRRTHPYTFG